jgi:hypothetical protein
MRGDDFSWGEGNSNVVLRAYGSVAVHENPYGDVVIRQERDALEDEDRVVVVPIQDAEYVARAIIDKVKEIKADPDWGKPKQPEPDAQQRLALPAPNGRQAASPVRNGGAGTATKTGAAHG